MPDGMLAHLRDTYPIEIVWAPRWAGDELRQARTGVESALAPEKELARMDEQIANLAAEHRQFARQFAERKRRQPLAAECDAQAGSHRPGGRRLTEVAQMANVHASRDHRMRSCGECRRGLRVMPYELGVHRPASARSPGPAAGRRRALDGPWLPPAYEQSFWDAA
jgi:hypothetical protein